MSGPATARQWIAASSTGARGRPDTARTASDLDAARDALTAVLDACDDADANSTPVATAVLRRAVGRALGVRP